MAEEAQSPQWRPSGWSASQTAAASAALACAYYVGVQIGFAFTLEANAVSFLWPPNALVLAALLIAPVRAWPWLIAAAAPAHFIAELSLDVPFSMVASWYVSNVTEALLGATLIRWLIGDAPRFDRVRDASLYLVAAALLAVIASSFLDASLVALIGWRYDGDFWQVLRTRLFSNAVAAITVAPLAVIAFTAAPRALRRASGMRYVEGAVLLALLCAISLVVFHIGHSAGQAMAYMYAPLPLLVWAAVRFGAGGAAACLAVVAVLSITGTQRGLGPFALAVTDLSVLALQIYLLIAGCSLMLLAAAFGELRHSRAAALRRKQSLDLALEAARMGAWDWDLLQDSVSWRFGAGGEGGAARSSASVRELLQMVHPDDRAAVEAAMRSARERSEPTEIECRFVCDGAERWLLSKGKMLRNETGEPQRVIGVCLDTTERKDQELQMRAQRDRLAQLGRAATLGELTGALAHELSQPLSAILINAHAAQRELESSSPDLPELSAMIADIANDDARAANVLHRLRALLMRQPVQTQPVDVGECIRGVLALEHSDLIAHKVALDVAVDRMLPPVMADEVQLQQVLLNLFVNARDALAANGSTERRLCISASHDGNGSVHIAVCDNGPGVRDLDRVFEPFYSTKSQHIGLGLAIARTIMTTHRGRLWGVNNPDGGATFHMVLPAASADAEGTAHVRSALGMSH